MPLGFRSQVGRLCPGSDLSDRPQRSPCPSSTLLLTPTREGGAKLPPQELGTRTGIGELGQGAPWSPLMAHLFHFRTCGRQGQNNTSFEGRGARRRSLAASGQAGDASALFGTGIECPSGFPLAGALPVPQPGEAGATCPCPRTGRGRLLPFQAAGKLHPEGRGLVSTDAALRPGHLEEPPLNELC